MTPPDDKLDMKRDWNERARQNARYFIATSLPEDCSEQEFDSSGRRDTEFMFEGLERLLNDKQEVLDIGCGIGRMDRHIAPRVGHLHGIDVSGEMVRQARERMAAFDNVSYHEGDGWKLEPFQDQGLDLVFSAIAFQHMPRQVVSSYFAEVHRVLRPGGHLLFQMPERGPNTPPDPSDHDSFEMRFHQEDKLQDELLALGFCWVETRRFPAGDPGHEFQQLRMLFTKTKSTSS